MRAVRNLQRCRQACRDNNRRAAPIVIIIIMHSASVLVTVLQTTTTVPIGRRNVIAADFAEMREEQRVTCLSLSK